MVLIIQSHAEIVYFIVTEKWQVSHIISFPFEYGNALAQVKIFVWHLNNGEDFHWCLVECSQLVLTNSAEVLSANGKTCMSL
jgi:hypothetical protein